METLSLALIAPGSTNPRKHFDPAAMAELTDSVLRHGVLQPVLVRPWPERRVPRGATRVPPAGTYELVAGERRLRAAKAAGLAEIPALVRDLSDAEVLEIQVVENLQRTDLHPLEEADGYRQLRAAGYDVARIAERVGRSVAYVYDRLRLANLTDDARKLFEEGRITAGHAVLLARLKPEHQAVAIETPRALFDREALLFDPAPREQSAAEDVAGKPMSVRELQAWIDQHVRLDVDAGQDYLEQLFPEVAAAVASPAVEAGEEKVVHITHEHYVQPTARDGSRIIGPRSWRPVEGKRCEYQATGVIVVGPGRGKAFPVCVEKQKCAVHWGAEIRARKKAAKDAEAAADKSGKTGAARSRGSADVERQVYEARRKKDEEEQKRWESCSAAILTAVAEAVRKAPAVATGKLADLVVEAACGGSYNSQRSATAKAFVPRGKTAEDLVRHAAFLVLADYAGDWDAWRTFPGQAKALGVDIPKILAAAAATGAPDAKPAKKAKRKAA